MSAESGARRACNCWKVSRALPGAKVPAAVKKATREDRDNLMVVLQRGNSFFSVVEGLGWDRCCVGLERTKMFG
jgi:hypothetical protein